MPDFALKNHYNNDLSHSVMICFSVLVLYGMPPYLFNAFSSINMQLYNFQRYFMDLNKHFSFTIYTMFIDTFNNYSLTYFCFVLLFGSRLHTDTQRKKIYTYIFIYLMFLISVRVMFVLTMCSSYFLLLLLFFIQNRVLCMGVLGVFVHLMQSKK